MVQCIVRYVLAVALGTILFALNQSVIVTPIDDMHHCMKIRACLDVLNMSLGKSIAHRSNPI